MAELSLSLVLTATNGRVCGAAPPVFPGVSTDTRTLLPGQLYVALKGERFDGHEFAAQALARDAGAVLVSRELEVAGAQIVVPDTLQALGAIAAAHRRELAPVVVGVTGSVGKTTTKDMVAAILSQGWRTAKTHGNFNNEIGLPLTLLGLEPAHQAVVVEMAMRGPGQIEYLASLARPQIGLVTNVGLSHLELLGTRDAIAEAKAELLEALPADGRAILNRDDEYFEFLAARSAAPVLSFGVHDAAEVRVTDLSLDAELRAQFRLTGAVEVQVTCGAPGRHHVFNAAAAAAAALAAGAPAEWIARGLAGYESGEMRGRVVDAAAGYTVVDDCYNAAPDSMRAALWLLMDTPGKRKWAALGDMRELGDAAVEQHHEIGRFVGRLGLAGLVTVGELGRHIAEGAREAGLEAVAEARDNASAAAELLAHLEVGDAILVKGSRAMQMEEIVRALLAREGGGHG